MKTIRPCSRGGLTHFALEQVQLQALATFLRMYSLCGSLRSQFRPNALILGLIGPICVDNGMDWIRESVRAFRWGERERLSNPRACVGHELGTWVHHIFPFFCHSSRANLALRFLPLTKRSQTPLKLRVRFFWGEIRSCWFVLRLRLPR